MQPASTEPQPWLSLECTFGPPFDGPWGLTLLPDRTLCVVERGSNGRPPRLSIVANPTAANPDEEFALRTIPLPPDVDDVQGAWCDGSTLFIADLGNNCVHRLLLPDGKPLAPSIGTGDADGALYCPRALCVMRSEGANPGAPAFGPALPDRLICVADAGNGRVMTYDSESLAPVRAIGKQAAEPGGSIWVAGELEQPLAVVAHAGELFVLDGYQHRCSVFCARSGRFARSIGGPGQLSSPFGVLVVRGMLLISEATRLQLFTLDGVHRNTLEVSGAENLSGMCVAEGGEHVYAADFTRGVAHRFRVGWADKGDRHGSELKDVDG